MSENSWEKSKDLADRHSEGAGPWLRLANDGDKAVGVFLGDPFPREVHFVERYVTCAGASCPHCGDGKRPSLRVAINFHTGKELRVFEMGTVTFKDLLKVRDKYGLDKWSFEIERHGESGDPKTTYSILPEERLSEKQLAEIKKLELHDLQKLYEEQDQDEEKAGKDAKPAGKAKGDAGGKAVDAKTASSLVVVLKSLPREATDRFLAKFGISRVRDLPASRVQEAVKLIDALEAEAKGKAPAEAVDPFA